MDKHSPPRFALVFLGPRYWPTWLALLCLKIIGYLPVNLALFAGKKLGDLFYRFAKSRRHIAEVNIRLCFPELNKDQQDQLVRSIMQSSGMSMMESALALWGPTNKFLHRHTITGLEHLEQARLAGRGVLLMGSHQITLDVTARVMGYHFAYDLLYRKDANPLLAYMLTRARLTFISHAIVRSDTRQLIRCLKEQHVVWYAPDQDYGAKHSIFAPFFGIQAASVLGTMRIPKLSNAMVIPLSHYRDEKNHYHIILGEPLADFPSGDDLADATRVNQVIEAAIRKQPDQYLWVHRRFKTRPAGEPSVY